MANCYGTDFYRQLDDAVRRIHIEGHVNRNNCISSFANSIEHNQIQR